jgi:glycosyltransferase involved in cell wall biosynthesis
MATETDPKRVTLFGLVSKHNGRNRGGTAVSISRLANYFSSQGLIVDIVMGKQDNSHFLSDMLNPKVNLYFVDLQSKIKLFWGLWRYVQNHQPAVLLSLDTRGNQVASWLKCVPGIKVHIWASLRNSLNSRHAKLFNRIYRRCNGVIAISEGLAKQFLTLANVDGNKMRVIYNAIITPELLPMSKKPVVHTWLNNNDCPVIMGIGRLTAQKDFATLLQAFAQVRKNRPCHLIILGEGEQRAQLESLAIELGITDDIALPGFQKNPWTWLSQADLFVLSSQSEGFGNVLAEALALGIPVVSTDCPFGPSEILEQGKYGPLVPVHDALALASAIEQTLDQPIHPQDLRQAAERFNVTLIGNKYLRIMGLTSG